MLISCAQLCILHTVYWAICGACPMSIEEGWREKQRQKSSHSRLFGGQNLFNSLLRSLFYLGLFGRNSWIPPFFQLVHVKIDSAAKNWLNSAHQTDVKNLPLLLFPSFFHELVQPHSWASLLWKVTSV